MAVVEILEVKRVNRNGRYYDRIKYTSDNKKKTSYRLWKPKNKITKKKQLKDDRTKAYKHQLEDYIVRKNVRSRVYKKRNQIRARTTRQVKGRAFYQTSIKLYVVVRYKNQTPFFYPQKGESSYLMRAANASEKSMLKAILGLSMDGGWPELQTWLKNLKKGGEIYVYGGWTYRRTYSRTGSFDGDAQYLDYFERKFNGNNLMRTINHYARYRKNKGVKKL